MIATAFIGYVTIKPFKLTGSEGSEGSLLYLTQYKGSTHTQRVNTYTMGQYVLKG